MNLIDAIIGITMAIGLLDVGNGSHMDEGGMYFMGYWMPWMMVLGVIITVIVIVLIVYLITRLADRGERVIVVK